VIEVAPRRESEVQYLFGLAKTAFADRSGWNDERVLDALATDVVLVAREQEQTIGYVALRRDADDTMVVEQVLVAPGYEHRGVGRLLLAHAEGYAIADRAATLRIVVEDGNLRARTFYRRLGFCPVEAELFELVLPRLGGDD
jgi:ribosomal protein S18 acetylase RimI-like enzyme